MRTLSKLAAAAAMALSVVALAPVALAADVKMIAQVTAIDMAADGKSALVTVKNTKGGAEVKADRDRQGDTGQAGREGHRAGRPGSAELRRRRGRQPEQDLQEGRGLLIAGAPPRSALA